MNNYLEKPNPDFNSQLPTNRFRSSKKIILILAISFVLFLLTLFSVLKIKNTNSYSQLPVDEPSRIISIPIIPSHVTSILPTAYAEKSISPTTIPTTIPTLSTNIIPKGNIKVAIIEFKFKDELKSDYYYEYYCKSNDCIFRTPEQDTTYYIDWCGKNCRIEKKSFFSVFNNPEGKTNIYPVEINQAKYSYYSIYQVKNFYENEAKKYRADLNISLEVKGPFILADKPPQRLRDQSPSLLEEFFDNEAKKNNIDISRYDIINYLYLTSENYLVATTNKNKTFNQSFIGFDDIFGGIQTVIHEMGHTFGAYDTYQPGSWPCVYPEGFPEPAKTPLYPQSKACLMCKSVMLAEKATRGPTDFNEIITCEAEAKRFGWK